MVKKINFSVMRPINALSLIQSGAPRGLLEWYGHNNLLTSSEMVKCFVYQDCDDWLDYLKESSFIVKKHTERRPEAGELWKMRDTQELVLITTYDTYIDHKGAVAGAVGGLFSQKMDFYATLDLDFNKC